MKKERHQNKSCQKRRKKNKPLTQGNDKVLQQEKILICNTAVQKKEQLPDGEVMYHIQCDCIITGSGLKQKNVYRVFSQEEWNQITKDGYYLAAHT